VGVGGGTCTTSGTVVQLASKAAPTAAKVQFLT